MNLLKGPMLDLIANADPNAYHERQLRSTLTEELLALSFHAFEETVKELLTRLGYADARLLGRTQWRQYTGHGGTDMEARVKVGLSESIVVLQVKQYRRPVSRRFVDELSGVIQRSGAREGIIITTSEFSRVAHRSAQSQKTASIRLIDGEELVNLLIQHRMCVVSENDHNDEGLDLDACFFYDLHRRFPNARRHPPDGCAKPVRALLTLPLTPTRIDSFKPYPMLWRTHVLAGINTLWLLYPFPNALTAQTLPLSILMVSLGALLPDIDAVESKIKNLGAYGITPLAPVSLIVNRTFGHRGILHSPVTLIPIAIVSAVLSFWVGVVPGISLLLGYGSHLVMDGMTRSGISFLPFSQRRLHLLPPRVRFVTGSAAEDVLMILLAMAAVLLLLHFFPFAL